VNSWRKPLCSARNDLAVLHVAFDHPVTIAAAQDTVVNAFLAEVIVPFIAGAAVVMLIRDRAIAIVAVDRVRADGRWHCSQRINASLQAFLKTLLAGSQLGEPFVAGSCTSNDGDLRD
jgi:hypothetical protein